MTYLSHAIAFACGALLVLLSLQTELTKMQQDIQKIQYKTEANYNKAANLRWRQQKAFMKKHKLIKE